VIIEERAYAEAVTAEQQALLALVPQRKGKLAIDVFEKIRAAFFVEVDQYFGIRLGVELMPLRLQFLTQFRIVKNFNGPAKS